MPMIDGRQAKAARVILGMTVDDMAEAAGLHRNSVMRLEKRKRLPRHCHAGDRIADAIDFEGIICDVIDGDPIVRFKTTATPPKYRRRVGA